jgi:hypothetical protein
MTTSNKPSPFSKGGFRKSLHPEPVAYTCRDERTSAQASDPILQDRICTKTTGKTMADWHIHHLLPLSVAWPL